eukprot:scaffold124173_cov29-Attheya_sp.AAC.1
MSSCTNLEGSFTVVSDKCTYNADTIISDYTYVSLFLLSKFRVPIVQRKMDALPTHRHATFYILRCQCRIVYRKYETTIVEGNVVKPVETKMQFKTEKK